MPGLRRAAYSSCVTACGNIQHVGAIAAQNRGFKSVISPAMGLPLISTACAMCGQCTVVCPTGALHETDGITGVWNAMDDPEIDLKNLLMIKEILIEMN